MDWGEKASTCVKKPTRHSLWKLWRLIFMTRSMVQLESSLKLLMWFFNSSTVLLRLVPSPSSHGCFTSTWLQDILIFHIDYSSIVLDFWPEALFDVSPSYWVPFFHSHLCSLGFLCYAHLHMIPLFIEDRAVSWFLEFEIFVNLWGIFADNRICVWNASDGSLVHSLTGHTASVSMVLLH